MSGVTADSSAKHEEAKQSTSLHLLLFDWGQKGCLVWLV